MRLSRYVKIYPCPDRSDRLLLYSTKRSSSVVASQETVQAAKEGTLKKTEARTLARLGICVDDPSAEREEMRNLFISANRLRRTSTSLVVLNLDCNLACVYCYEDNFRGKHYMSTETADLLVETIRRDRIEHGMDVVLQFYGGEPLLSQKLISDISRRLKSAADAKGTGYRFSLVTNGTLLTRKVAEELVPLGLSGAKVTLDGPKDLHNESRPFVSGKGSFDLILKNVSELCDLIPLQLGGNFTRENYHRFPLLLDDLRSAGITPEKAVTVLFAPVIPKSGEKAVSDFNGGCACSYEPWLVEASVFLREETLKRGYPAPKIRMSVCMVEYENDLVVNYDGSLYKCPAFMAYDFLRIGTLEEGISDYRASHGMDIWKNEECLDCPYLPLCFGGCRQLTLVRTGKIGGVDCRRDFYDAALERFVLQDLKYQRTCKK